MDNVVEKFVNTLDEFFNAEDIGLNVYGCVECNQCGQACAWYMETGDEKLHPRNRSDFIRRAWKSGTTLGKAKQALGVEKPITLQELRDNMSIYWACTLCGRCTLSCPLGISNRRLYRAARAAYTESGLSQENPTLKAIIDNTRTKRHSFGLSREEIFAKPGLFLGHEGMEAPVDVKGAEYLFVCPAAGNTKIPELGIKMIKALNVAGVDYTVSTDIVDTGTEIDHIAVHHELSRQMLIEWEDAAEKLGSKVVLIAECGCDVRTMYVDAQETLGRPFRFPIMSIDSLFERLISEGKIPVEKIDESVTFHDPCYVTRLSGMGDRYRDIIHMLVKDFREMTPNREQNYCCNAGAGGMRMPENTEMRRKISVLKANQIANTGAEIVTTPCAICYLGIKDTTEHYKLATPDSRKARMFFEIIYDAMVKALKTRGELERMKRPASLSRLKPEELPSHTLSGFLEKLKKHPGFSALMEKLRKDPNVNNYAREAPAFWGYFDAVAQKAAAPERSAG
jgi:Fe-S oxidoreductase